MVEATLGELFGVNDDGRDMIGIHHDACEGGYLSTQAFEIEVGYGKVIQFIVEILGAEECKRIVTIFSYNWCSSLRVLSGFHYRNALGRFKKQINWVEPKMPKNDRIRKIRNAFMDEMLFLAKFCPPEVRY
jgi:hypothetical protein